MGHSQDKHAWHAGKADAAGNAAVNAVYGVLRARLNEQPVVLLSLQCLLQCMLLLPSAATVLRLEGCLHAALAALQVQQQDASVAECGAQLLVRMCQGSPVAAQALASEQAHVGLLLLLLQRHVANEAIAAAVCDVLQVVSRYSKVRLVCKYGWEVCQ